MSEKHLPMRLPVLRWRLSLEPASSLKSVIAHSFAAYELVFEKGGEFSEAYLVDIRQGVIWGDSKPGLTYITRGVRLYTDRLVDAGDETILKIGFKPERLLLGRRIVALLAGKHVKIVDRTMLTESASLKSNLVRYDGDEYTLAIVAKTRRGSTLVADTIFGYTIENLERQPHSIATRRGCTVACSRYSCIASNGLDTEYIAANSIEPLAALRKSCIVATKSTGQWIILMIAAGATEAIGACRDKPITLYSDDTTIIYSCDGRIYRMSEKRSMAEDIGSYMDGALLTPSRRARVEKINGVETVIIEEDDSKILVPVEEYYTVHKDTLLAVSGSWVYSLDLSTRGEHTASIENDGCPITMHVSLSPYIPLKLEADGQASLERVNISASTVLLCLKPLTLESEALSITLRAYLAPPLILEQSVKIPVPKPRLAARAYRVRGAAEILDPKGSRIKVNDGDVIVIAKLDESWLSIVANGTMLLLNEDRDVIDSQPVGDEVILYAPRRYAGDKLVLALKTSSTVFEYLVDTAGDLEAPTPPLLELRGRPRLVDAGVAVLPVSIKPVEGANLILVDGKRVEPGDIEISVDVGESPSVCACRSIPGSRSYICGCRIDEDLREKIVSHLASISRIQPSKLWMVDTQRREVRLRVHAEKEGLAHIRVEVGDGTPLLATHIEVGKGVNNVRLRLVQDTLLHKPLTAILYVTDARGVRKHPLLLVPYKPSSLIAYKVNNSLIVCADGLLVYEDDSLYTVSECARLAETGKLIVFIDKCGYLHKPRLEVVDMLYSIRAAVRAARVIAEKLPII